MTPDEKKILERIAVALERIANGMDSLTNDGLTIFGGEEFHEN